MNAIDTNVLAYTFDPAEPIKQAKARSPKSILLWQDSADYDGGKIINPFA